MPARRPSWGRTPRWYATPARSISWQGALAGVGQVEQHIDDVARGSGHPPQDGAREQDVRLVAGDPGRVGIVLAVELDDVDHSVMHPGADQRDDHAGGVLIDSEPETVPAHGKEPGGYRGRMI